MTKALETKPNKYQVEYYWVEFQWTHREDWAKACSFCARGNKGWLPKQDVFADAICASKEMRLIDEKLKRETDLTHTHKTNFTPEERLISNRAANEAQRQAKTGRATGENRFDPEKVRLASADPSKDAEIREKYGDEGPTPAQVFGYSFASPVMGQEEKA
jgi:hypothetical protein